MTDLLSYDEVVAACGMTAAPTPQGSVDRMVRAVMAALTPVIENITGPVVVDSVTVTKSGGNTGYILPHRPTSITSVTENGTPTTDYYADLSAGIIYGGSRLTPRAFALGEVVVTYMVGSETVPGNIKFAACELARHWWQLGQNSASPEWNGATDPEPFVPSGFAVPKRVMELLQGSERLPGFA